MIAVPVSVGKRSPDLRLDGMSMLRSRSAQWDEHLARRVVIPAYAGIQRPVGQVFQPAGNAFWEIGQKNGHLL